MFEVGGERFGFTIAVLDDDAKRIRLESDGNVYNLRAADAAPADDEQPKPRKPNPLYGERPRPAEDDRPVDPAPRADAAPLIFEPQTLVDPTTKLEVATLLVPRGWELDPSTLWRNLAAQFVTLNGGVFDRAGGRAVRWIPIDQFTCSPTVLQNARQQGAQPVSGGMELTERVPSAAEYVREVVLPRYRNVEGLQVVDTEDLEALARSIDESKAHLRAQYQQMGRELQHSAARVRVEYPGEGDGAVVEEDIYCVLNVSWDVRGNANARAVGVGESWWYAPERLYGLSAPKGQLDEATPALYSIVASVRPTARWTAFVDNIQKAVGKIAIDRHAMEMAARAAITEIQQKTWQASCAAADKQSAAVGDLIRGTQTYKNPNPNGPPIVGPAGQKGWMNSQGQFTSSSDPNYDPGKDPGAAGGGNWTPLDPQ